MLSVGYSTATPDSVRTFVADRFDLGPITSCDLLSRGFNDTYALQARAGRFVFRISGIRARGPADVAHETAFIAHLARQGVAVAEPVALRDGTLATTVEMPEDHRAAVLFHEAPGRAPGLDTPEDAAAQARTLAALHRAAASFAGPGGYAIDAERLLRLPVLAIVRTGIAQATTLQKIEALAERLAGRLDGVEPDLTRILCHGDCHGLNARIAADGGATFFDFDECGHGFLAYDLAVHLWAQISFGRRRHAIWHAFVAAYRAAHPLAPADLAAIDLFVPMRHLWLMGEYCGLTTRWGREAITAAWLERETEFLLEWERDRLGPSLL